MNTSRYQLAALVVMLLALCSACGAPASKAPGFGGDLLEDTLGFDLQVEVSPDSSDTSNPDTSNPDTSNPDTSHPDTSHPDTSSSDTSHPDTSSSDTSHPDTSSSDTSDPDTSSSDTSSSDTSSSDTSDPDTSDPDTSDPDTSPSDTSDPDTADTFPTDTADPQTDSVQPECAEDQDCQELLAPLPLCVAAVCLPDGHCDTVVALDFSPCDDGNPCTTGDACLQELCMGYEVICNDFNECTTDICNDTSGLCSYLSSPGPCSDGDPCTEGDLCLDGKCSGVPVSCDDQNPCTGDLCGEDGKCVHSDLDWPCDDGDACTFGDRCKLGNCEGAEVACSDGLPCTVDSCDPATGCKADPLPLAGKPCDDGSACTRDDVCVAGYCEGTKTTCHDGNDCTTDACDPASGCAFPPAAPGPCNDGDACTLQDACTNGHCLGQPLQCNDLNPCTENKCDPARGECVFPVVPDSPAAPCDDQNPCTTSSACLAGVCTGLADTNCDDGDLCTLDYCNQGTGACVHVNNSAACDDGDKCTLVDICQNGHCVGNGTVQCYDFNGCTDDSCDPAKGCTFTNNNAPCEDFDFCTTNDLCEGGTCKAGLRVCDCMNTPQCAVLEDGDPCNGTLVCRFGECVVDPATVPSCDPSGDTQCRSNQCNHTTGKCELATAANGLPCNDQDACTSGESCQEGACTGNPVTCPDDANQCTDQSCDPALGCVVSKPSRPCDDGDACTLDDTCNDGVCTSTPKDCADTNPCTDDYCAPVGGQPRCVHEYNTSPCNDSNACTANDTCASAACVGTTVPCDDSNPCTADSCDPASGCVFTNADGVCDDAKPCTLDDTCVGGTCLGKDKVCDDGKLCTDDNCDPATGGCRFLSNTLPCTDNSLCTTGDICQDGACVATPLVCDDSDPCTDDSCNPSVGCIFAFNTAPCDDSKPCTENDTCANGACLGSAVNCNDGNLCTDDSCNPDTGDCVHTPNFMPCYDGDPCTMADFCTGGTCKGLAPANCNDNIACTTDSCLKFVGCMHMPNASACNDNNPCTTESCQASTGCVFSAVGGSCNDNNPCTENDTCTGGTCKGTVKVCLDANPCTDDYCDSDLGGCAFVANTASCSDLNPCTDQDLCLNGSCLPGSLVLCNDNNPCTTDVCLPAKGCTFLPTPGGGCDDLDSCTGPDQCQDDGQCAGAPIADCCNDDSDCPSTYPCYQGECDLPTATCVYYLKTCSDGLACTLDVCAPTSGACSNPILASEQTLFFDDFSTDNGGWVIQAGPGFNEGDVVADQVQWHRGTWPNFSPTHALISSDPTTTLYAFEAPYTVIDAQAASPAIYLEPGAQANLTFQLYSDIEDGYDELRVFIWTPDASAVMVGTHNTRNQAWEAVSYNLDAYAGKTLRVIFQFVVFDSNENAYPGFAVDDVRVSVLAKTGCCNNDAGCTDNDLCTLETCSTSHACSAAPVPGTWLTQHWETLAIPGSWKSTMTNGGYQVTVTGRRSVSTPYSVYFGEPAMQMIYPMPGMVTLESPLLDLTNAKTPVLSYKLWADFQMPGCVYASFHTRYRTPVSSAINLNSRCTGTNGLFEEVRIPLSSLVGQKVYISFQLRSDTTYMPKGEGAYLDDLKIEDEGLVEATCCFNSTECQATQTCQGQAGGGFCL